MDKTIVLEIQHISKKFKNYDALKEINFQLHKGEIAGFLGPSGAGKTTTIKIATGQLKQTSGTTRILGEDSRRINQEIYKRIGVVSDNSGFYEKLSVYENLRMFARLLNVPLERIDILLKRVGLYEHRKKHADKLSRGQKQRLVLVRAILHQPEILFLDEPTSGLDPATAKEVHQLLLELKNEGMAIFLTTHNMEEATKLCDKVFLINRGLVVESGSPEELCLKYYKEFCFDVRLKNGDMHTLKSSEENLGQVMQWFKENTVQTIHSKEPNLEKVFLTVTGEELS